MKAVKRSMSRPAGSFSPGCGLKVSVEQSPCGQISSGKLRAGDPHLVERGVAGELEQAGDVRLPSEAPHGRQAGSQVDDCRRPSGNRRRLSGLRIRQRLEDRVGRCIDEAEAEDRLGPPGSHHVRLGGDDLRAVVEALDRANPVVVKEGAALLGEGVEAAVGEPAAIPCLQALVASTNRRGRVVALGADRLVEDRTQAAVDDLLLPEGVRSVQEAGQLRRRHRGERLAELAPGEVGGERRGPGILDSTGARPTGREPDTEEQSCGEHEGSARHTRSLSSAGRPTQTPPGHRGRDTERHPGTRLTRVSRETQSSRPCKRRR